MVLLIHMLFKIHTALVSLVVYSVLLFLPVSVYAQDSTGGLQPPAGSIATDIKPESVPQLVINTMFYIGTFLAVAYLMYGGIRWITSRGDKQGVEAARKHIMAAIMGIIVVAGAFFILQVVFNVLGADNPISKNFQLPTLKNINK